MFQDCVDKYVPVWRNQLFISQFPDLFPVDPVADHIPLLVDMFLDPLLVPHTPTGQPSIRNLGPATGTGDAKLNFNWYLKERGDANIQSLTDLINKASFFIDTPAIPNQLASLTNSDSQLTLSNPNVLQNRFALRTIVHQCFAKLDLDAVVYPTGNIPPSYHDESLRAIHERQGQYLDVHQRQGLPCDDRPGRVHHPRI
jgi:amidase